VKEKLIDSCQNRPTQEETGKWHLNVLTNDKFAVAKSIKKAKKLNNWRLEAGGGLFNGYCEPCLGLFSFQLPVPLNTNNPSKMYSRFPPLTA